MLDRAIYRIIISAAIFLIGTIFFVQDSLPQSKVWHPAERTGLGRVENFNAAIEKLISVPLNPNNPEDGSFDLHYFVQTPKEGMGLKTVLFCFGGPGELARPSANDPTFADPLQQSGYNIVYFDLRGSGFSQIPASNQFDKYLRTANAVEDIEKIRQDFLGEKSWDAIIGYSYGTVLAQEYAHKYQEEVDKVILIGPQSMHQFASSGNPYEEYTTEVQRVRREVLEKLYTEREEFQAIDAATKSDIMNELFGSPSSTGLFKRIEDSFGSEQFVIDNYCELNKSGILKKYGFGNYSRYFFEMLRNVRFVGWQSVTPTTTTVNSDQVEIVKVITLVIRPELKKYVGELQPRDECSDSQLQQSARVFNAMGIYDGLNRRFLKEWFAAGKHGIHEALVKSGGLANIEMGVNKSINKVGIDENELIQPWDPANYPHNRPTLILKGGADPVTALGQAERYYTSGLNGPRILIEFEGVGHYFYLPRGSNTMNHFSDGAVLLDPPRIPPGKTVWVTGTISNVREIALEKSEGDLYFEKLQFEPNNTVLVHVTNSSASVVSMPDKEFTLNDTNFTGTVTIDRQDIPAHANTWISGKIRIALKFTVEPPADLDGGLEFTGSVDTDSWNNVYVEIRNNNAFSVDGEPKSWIYKPVALTSQNTACLTGNAVNSLSCILYAFVEAEYPDFIRAKSGILERIQTFVKHPPKICWKEGCDRIDK